MKQALIFLKEINRKKDAIKNTKSKYLIEDYTKSIEEDEKELKEYCLYKGIDYEELKQ